jgi:hypothetical protein
MMGPLEMGPKAVASPAAGPRIRAPDSPAAMRPCLTSLASIPPMVRSCARRRPPASAGPLHPSMACRRGPARRGCASPAVQRFRVRASLRTVRARPRPADRGSREERPRRWSDARRSRAQREFRGLPLLPCRLLMIVAHPFNATALNLPARRTGNAQIRSL